MLKSVSIVIPVFNEQKNINNVYKNLIKALKITNTKNYEIIFVEDGSKDGSLDIIKKLKKKNKNIRLSINKFNRGLGFTIKKGMLLTKKKYAFFLPSDNEHKFDGLIPLLKNFEKYDLVIPYVTNKNARPIHRRIISYLYLNFINIIFCNSIPYYNGLVVYKSSILKKHLKKINNFSFSFLAELLLRCLRVVKNYKIIGYKINYLKSSNSSALKLKNIYFSIYFILLLRLKFWFKQN